MALIERMSGEQDPKIAVHQFWAALSEYALGKVTLADIKSAFSIVEADDVNELDWLIGKYTNSTDKPHFVTQMHAIFLLSEQGLFGYNDRTAVVSRINELP